MERGRDGTGRDGLERRTQRDGKRHIAERRYNRETVRVSTPPSASRLHQHPRPLPIPPPRSLPAPLHPNLSSRLPLSPFLPPPGPAWFVKTRCAPSRHSRDPRVYIHTTTVMHKLVTSPPTPPEKETCRRRRQGSTDQMGVDPVQGNTPREDKPSRGERRRAGAEGVTANPTMVRGSNGATAPLGSSTDTGTATGEGHQAMKSAPAEGLISSRTRSRTRIAATVSARSSAGGRGGQLPTGLIHRASPHQPTMARMASSATHSQPAPSLPEQSLDTSGASQPPKTEMGPPLTAPRPLGASSTPTIEGAPLTGEAPPQTSGSAQPPQRHQRPWPAMPPIAQPTVFESRTLQPSSRKQSQSPIQPPPAISVPFSTPSTTAQPPSATSPPARSPIASSPSPVTVTVATAAAAAADSWPSLDSDTSLATRCSPCARNVIAGSE